MIAPAAPPRSREQEPALADPAASFALRSSLAAITVAIAAPFVADADPETALAAAAAVSLGACAHALFRHARAHRVPAASRLAWATVALAAGSCALAWKIAPGWVATGVIAAGSLLLVHAAKTLFERDAALALEQDELRARLTRREGDVRTQAERIRRLDLFERDSGLLNARGFLAATSRALAECEARQEPLALLLVEMRAGLEDGPKDARGKAGARLAARAVTSAVRGSDVAGRLAPDRFAILLAGCRDPRPALGRLERALASLEQDGGPKAGLGGVTVAERGPWPDADGLVSAASAALAAAGQSDFHGVVPTLWPIEWGLASARASHL